jgi:hypothetical protein
MAPSRVGDADIVRLPTRNRVVPTGTPGCKTDRCVALVSFGAPPARAGIVCRAVALGVVGTATVVAVADGRDPVRLGVGRW